MIKKPGCMYSNLIPSSNWEMDPAIPNYRCLAPILALDSESNTINDFRDPHYYIPPFFPWIVSLSPLPLGPRSFWRIGRPDSVCAVQSQG